MNKYISLMIVGFLSMAWQTEVTAKTYTRYEAHTKEGQKALASMKKAMAKLKAIGCTNPISCYYQGAMHWTPDVSFSNLNKNPLCPSFDTAHLALLLAWDNCASHNQTGPNSDIHFLPWHRLYVLYLEKIIRETSGDPDFALPYWNYGAVYTMPKPFQAADGGSLYEQSRRVSLNKGQPIDTNEQATLTKDLKQLSQVQDYATFNKQLNFGVHGFMHDYIGGNDGTFNPIYNAVITKTIDPNCVGCGMMGEVPSAGFDPIFWMHHSNVDRLYQNFIDANPGQNITLAQLNSVQWPYDFFEIIKAPSGYKLAKHTMPEVLADISTIDYKYDERALAAQPAVNQVVKVEMKEKSVLSMPAKASASLKTPTKLSVDLPVTIKEILPLAASKSRAILELDVSYNVNHKGRCEVFLDLPEMLSASDKDAEKHFVGAISFFVNDPQGKGGNQVLRYDINDELAASKAEQKNFALSIMKTHGPEEGEIVIHMVTVIKMEENLV